MTKPNWIDVHFPLYGRPRKIADAWICRCGMANVSSRPTCSYCSAVAEHANATAVLTWSCPSCGESGRVGIDPQICRCLREAQAKAASVPWKCLLCGERVGHGFHECTPKPEEPT